MRKVRRMTTLMLSVVLMVSLLPAVGVSADGGSNGEIVVVGSAHHSTVDGVDFTRFDCRYQGSADAVTYERLDGTAGKVDFDVSCSLIIPTDPADWNGIILVEPLDSFAPFVPAGEVSRFLYIGEDVIFGGKAPQPRSGYASIGYQGYSFGDSIDQDQTLDENGDFTPDLAASTVEILADFPLALRGGTFDGLTSNGDDYGAATSVIVAGLSNQATAIRGAMAFGEAHGFAPFDAAMPMASALTLTQTAGGRTAWNIPGPVDFGDQKALFINTESEVVLNGTADVFGFFPVFSTIPLRVEADDVNRFIYELPGAAHLDPPTQDDFEFHLGLVAPGTFDNSSPVDWTPIRRAIYMQMHDWVMHGDTPEPSRIMDAPVDPAAPDPAYPGHPSVEFATVARDTNLNATGGVRHPDVEVGAGTYVGVGPPISFSGDLLTEFLQWLAGGFTDLSCVGSEAHDNYVEAFSETTNQLARDRFLLRADAQQMRADARASSIGLCE